MELMYRLNLNDFGKLSTAHQSRCFRVNSRQVLDKVLEDDFCDRRRDGIADLLLDGCFIT